jgi:tetratricopeptide (TPR) repeat protein
LKAPKCLWIFALARACVLACALLASTPARAGQRAPTSKETPASSAGDAASIDAEVERHRTMGQRLLGRGQTQEAIAEFRRGYELRGDARFLYYIAEGYRQLGLRDQALFFYQRYLSAAPDAPEREDVEELIAGLEASTPPRAAPRPAPPASLAHDVVIVPVDADHAPTSRPLWRRWWVWTALGALVVGSAAVALTAGRARTEVPPTALGDKRFY